MEALSGLFGGVLGTVGPFILVLGVLIFIHELGHYLAARSVGVHVDVFSIGFGRAIAGWTGRDGTYWKIGWIPLGGFVKLHGQESPEDRALQRLVRHGSVNSGAAAVGVRDERGREREQTDCEHDERAVQ